MEAVGAAASILQIAQLGFQLFQALQKFAADAKRADKELQAVADDVKHLSTALRRAHGEIEAGSQLKLYTAEALRDFEDVLEGVQKAFQQIRDLLEFLMKTGDGSRATDSSAKPALKTRLRWAFNKKDEMELLRSNLERLKSSLLLMLGVFNLALGRRSASSTNDNAATIRTQEQEIRKLFAEKEAAQKMYQHLLSSVSGSTLSSGSDEKKSDEKSCDIGIDQVFMAFDTTTMTRSMPTIPKDPLSSSLEDCATAVARLADTINTAINQWSNQRTLDVESMDDKFHVLSDVLQRTLYDALEMKGAVGPQNTQFMPRTSSLAQENNSSDAPESNRRDHSYNKIENYVYESRYSPSQRAPSFLRSRPSANRVYNPYSPATRTASLPDPTIEAEKAEKSDSDIEAAQGLAMMLMAEEELARRDSAKARAGRAKSPQTRKLVRSGIGRAADWSDEEEVPRRKHGRNLTSEDMYSGSSDSLTETQPQPAIIQNPAPAPIPAMLHMDKEDIARRKRARSRSGRGGTMGAAKQPTSLSKSSSSSGVPQASQHDTTGSWSSNFVSGEGGKKHDDAVNLALRFSDVGSDDANGLTGQRYDSHTGRPRRPSLRGRGDASFERRGYGIRREGREAYITNDAPSYANDDDDTYSYTDAAAMYRDTEPRRRETRPRRGSIDRREELSRERPVSMTDPGKPQNLETESSRPRPFNIQPHKEIYTPSYHMDPYTDENRIGRLKERDERNKARIERLKARKEAEVDSQVPTLGSTSESSGLKTELQLSGSTHSSNDSDPSWIENVHMDRYLDDAAKRKTRVKAEKVRVEAEKEARIGSGVDLWPDAFAEWQLAQQDTDNDDTGALKRARNTAAARRSRAKRDELDTVDLQAELDPESERYTEADIVERLLQQWTTISP